MPALGGLRHARADSPNGGWRNKSFRGYADHMQSAAFRDAIAALVRTGMEARTAIMCAEAVPWRCHRSLIADALRSEEHTSELQSLMRISYAVFCLKKK